MEIILELEPEKEHAKLLIQSCPNEKTFEDAIKIIESSGIPVIKVKLLPAKHLMILLGSEDMREIVLNLTEQGYIIQGVNALR